MSYITELIEHFSEETLMNFLQNKIGSLDRNQEDCNHLFSNTNISQNFNTIKIQGNAELEDQNSLIVITTKSTKQLSSRSGKKMQYDIAKKIIKNQYADAAIFVAYDNNGNFRFSFIYAEYKGTQREFSHYKRYTYYVSKDQPNRTFIKQLEEADFASLENIKEAFSVKQLTKEFYNEIQNWYAYALNELNNNTASFPAGKNEEHLIRLLTRLVFVWFIKERKLIPEEIFDEEKLKNIVKKFKTGNNYYNVILQNLFFATLNRDPQKRTFANDGNFQENKKHFGVKTLYRYADKLLITEEEFIKLLETVPFINGGLFECLDKDNDYIDGFSRNDNKRAKLPDYLFFSDEKDTDLTFFYGARKKEKVRGLINILKEYNFTADESSPIDVEVSLDPELLGHIFENLLASYNPETQTTARKSTGSYYTPKEIVDFMVDEALIHYFFNKTSIEESKLRELISYDETQPLTDEEKQKIITAIDNLKIIDPAVGSGAFPMGVLHKLVHILHKLDPDNEMWKQKQIQRLKKIKQETSGIQNTKIRNELLKDIENQKKELEKAFKNELDYSRKLFLIENSIYGVDIQPIAIQIAKLRFFLSLLIDQKIDENQKNYGILPLPNLETKFVAANTLIGLEKPKQGNLFRTPKIIQLEENYKELMKSYFSASTRTQKKRLQERAKQVRKELADELKKVNFSNETTEKIVNFDIFDQLSSADWFDPEWMFGITDGFDIVIGNPPYIQLQKAFDEQRKYADLYKNLHFKTFTRTGDIYALFYEKGMELLQENGILAYITSNKWMRAGYGEKLRKFLATHNPLILIDLGPGVFENATVDTNIILIQKNKPQKHNLKAVTLNKPLKELKQQDFVTLTDLSEKSWIILSPQEQKIKERIEEVGTPLKDWNISIYRGVLTGYNEAFIIDGKTKDALIKKDPKSAEIIKPILRGRDIKRYKAEFADLWLIFIPWHFPLHKDPTISGASVKAEKEFQKQYPAIYSHLLQYKDKLSKRNKAETGIRYEWYALQRCAASYYQEFEKEKIVYSEIVRSAQFFYDSKGYFAEATSFLLTGENVKYLTSLLNSRPVTYFFKTFYAGGGLGDEGFRYKKAFLINLPIPRISRSRQKPFETLVDYILFLKTQDKDTQSNYFEQIIDGMVYELYFEEEIKQAGCEIIKHLQNLPEITQEMSKEEKQQIIDNVFAELHSENHPVRSNLKKMQELKFVKVIEGEGEKKQK